MNMALDTSSLAQSSKASGDKLQARILDRDELLSLGNAWDELVAHALEENAYYCRQYVTALLAHVEKRPVKALAVYRGNTLVALLPFITDRRHWLGLAKINKAWTTLYTTLSIPLIDVRCADEAIDVLVTAMGDGTAGSTIWLLPSVTLEGDVYVRLAKTLVDRDLSERHFDTFDRAVMNQNGNFEDHKKNQFSKKRRKELERIRRRLSDKGVVSERTYTEGPELEHAVEEFLRIEASGWKGDQGTALSCSDASRAFARQAFGPNDGKSITRADMLMLGDKPIAAELTIQTGRTGFTIKCAFDETYRTQGAGLLLFENCIRNFLDNDWADRLDSAAAGGHMIEALWNGTIKMGDVLLAAGPTRLPFSFYSRLEATRRTLRAQAKSIVNRLRR